MLLPDEAVLFGVQFTWFDAVALVCGAHCPVQLVGCLVAHDSSTPFFCLLFQYKDKTKGRARASQRHDKRTHPQLFSHLFFTGRNAIRNTMQPVSDSCFSILRSSMGRATTRSRPSRSGACSTRRRRTAARNAVSWRPSGSHCTGRREQDAELDAPVIHLRSEISKLLGHALTRLRPDPVTCDDQAVSHLDRGGSCELQGSGGQIDGLQPVTGAEGDSPVLLRRSQKDARESSIL